MPQCRGRTRDGSRCKNNAIPGTKSCYLASHGGYTASPSRRVRNYIANHPLFLLLCAVGSVASVVALSWAYSDRLREAYEGLITAPRGAEMTYLAVGATRFTIEGPRGVFLRDGETPLLSLKLVNDALLVSTVIRDPAGNIVAELRDNEWSINRNAAFDRNYTKNVLECRDNQGRVTLQVVHFGNTIHVGGTFRCRNGWTTTLGPIGAGGALMDIRPPGETDRPEYQIPEICKYPSRLHFGDCPGVTELRGLVRHDAGTGYILKDALDICTHHPTP
jgi:hypothetical protein